jgi:hypothetical protein
VRSILRDAAAPLLRMRLVGIAEMTAFNRFET